MKEFFQFIIDYAKANIRNKRLMAAERIALRLTNEDRRSRWIIRGQGNKYVVFTKYEVDRLKEQGILTKDVNIIKLSEVADSHVRYSMILGRACVDGKSNKK